jgi:hypothetical protein
VLSLQDASDGARFQKPTGPEFNPGLGISSEELDRDIWKFFQQTGPGAATLASSQTLVVKSSKAMTHLTIKHDVYASVANAAASELAKTIQKYAFPESAKAEAITGCVDAVRTAFDGARPALSNKNDLWTEFKNVYNGTDQCKNVYEYLVKDTNDATKTGKDKPAEDDGIFVKVREAAGDWVHDFGQDLLDMATDEPR